MAAEQSVFTPNAGGCEVSPAAVASELSSILASDSFIRAERPSRFLRHLVEAELRGDSRSLRESALGIQVFERPSDWDARLDPVVRQEASRLRKRLAKYYEAPGTGAVLRIELPVGAYVPVFRPQPAEAAPVAVVQEPLDDIGRAPIEPVPTPQVPAREKASSSARSRWMYGAAAGLICALLGICWWQFAPYLFPVSIVVLPLASLGSDPATQAFADGLTDEITDSLARLSTIRVIARSSAFRYQSKPVDIHQIGKDLNVNTVLEGSVQRSGNRIRVIARLERVSDGALVWSNSWERPATDLFALEGELASGIAAHWKRGSVAPAYKHVPNPQAHELVLQAKYDQQQMTGESLAKAEAEYQRAIDLDPEYAGAWAGLATAQYNRGAARGSLYQSDSERKNSERLFHKALSLDPGLGGARAMLATLAMQYDWDWPRAEREFQAAVAGGSNATAESMYGCLLVFRGRFKEADEHLQRSLDLDPFSTSMLNNIAFARNLEGRYGEAREVALRIQAGAPKMLAPRQMLGMIDVEEGHPDAALPIIRKLEQTFPPAALFEAMALAKAGQRDQALRLMAPFERKYPDSGVPMQWFALAYAFLGDEPNTVKWLERSADAHEWQVLNIGVHPVYANMRASAAFQALIRRIGLNR